MKVLVACEHSGTVRRAFRAKGHNAWSCDLLPAEDQDEHHLQGDCAEALQQRWDLIIMHPPCTALAVSGNRWYGFGMQRYDERLASIHWTMALWHLAIKRADSVCMENPVGVLPIKATQYIQPWQFGHPESKRTGLWLHNLPRLATTNVLEKPPHGTWSNQTPSGQNKLGPSPDRWKKRSKTYPGIAEAMADQWGK